MKGRVIQSTGSWYKVRTEDGRLWDARLRGKFRLEGEATTNPIAVGDIVVMEENEDGSTSILEIEDRHNWLTRKATRQRDQQQILVANVDRAFVVQSIRKPKIKTGFIDRFLVTCEAYEIPPRIIINKMDLATDKDQSKLEDITSMYRDIGYTVYCTSIKKPETLEPLQEEIKDHTCVFVGHSGVGKTSLLNHLDPNLNLKVGDISDYSEKGKHTTTFAQLVPLSTGGYLVDTPGIKEFGLVNIEPSELSLFFPEMLGPRQDCKFYDCTHSHEPGCGVMKAYEEGKIHPRRYESYLNMLDSISE
ncbi:MAG: ribosome small subunit-dependent GTPase A [Bacteroidota bacterium]